jgi:3-hydroxyisobutyrate dehydrogenase
MGESRIERVAFLGLGIMGRPMAANVARAGFDVIVWNRTREKAEALAQEHGTRVASSPAEAASAAEATITMVVDAPQVEEVLFGDRGAAEGASRGSVFIDMSTIAPTASRRIGERLADAGIAFLDAPVTGSRPKAEDATLTIMAGGDAEEFERSRPLLEAMGELVIHVGPQGHGSMTKLINNTVAAINAAAVGEALVTGRAAGLDLDKLIQVIRSGSGASAMLDLKAPAMLERDFEPLFKLEHMLKDIRHCLAEAKALGMRLELAAAAEELYARADASGDGQQDFAAVFKATEAAAGGSHPGSG